MWNSSEIFDMFNARSLDDEEFIYSFAVVITSRPLDSFNVNGKNLRHAMLSILQKNFQNADNFKRDNMEKFYNSIKLLGEYFNKARLSNGVPINIIGQSLLNLINVELEKELRNICHLKNEHFAKLVLSQVRKVYANAFRTVTDFWPSFKIALNGNLLKIRHKTEIEQVLFTIRKCLIELESLTPKNKAFLIMTLDLYYSNFTNVGDSLEKMYETFLVEDMKVVSRSNAVENNANAAKAAENGKVQASLERMSITKKPEERRRSAASPARSLKLGLKIQIRNTEAVKHEPASPLTNAPRSPQKTSQPNRIVQHSSPYRSVSQSRVAPQSPKSLSNRSLSQTPTHRGPQMSPTTRNAPHYSSNRSASQTPPGRRAPQSSTSRNAPHYSTNRSASQTPPNRSGPMSPTTRNPQQAAASRSFQQTPKKTSPQDLRSKKSPPMTNGYTSEDPNDKSEKTAIAKIKNEPSTNSQDNESVPPTTSDSSLSNTADENILRQQNSRSSTPSSTATPAKYKVNSKVYFREENVENLTWNGETSFEGDPDDLDESTSPKVNPYSSSFLNFLKTNWKKLSKIERYFELVSKVT